MRPLYSYLALALMIPLALIPPIDFFISNPSTDKWFMIILVAGFLGLYTLFIKTDWMVKFIAIGAFVDCFFSAGPFISFTSYVSVVLCCYFYILCSKIEDWTPILKAFQTLLFLNVLLIFMQNIGQDSLLNWGLYNHFTCFGAVGHHMQMASFAVVLCAFLISYHPSNFLFPILIAVVCSSTWTILTAIAGIYIWAARFNRTIAMWILMLGFLGFALWSNKLGKFEENLSPKTGRAQVWKETFDLANQRPWTGWGPGTYKLMFPALVKWDEARGIPYKTAHNAVLQLLFETGYIFTGVLLGGWLFAVYRLMALGQWMLVAGNVMIFLDMQVHFPDRMIQCVLILICFAAFCRWKVRDERV